MGRFQVCGGGEQFALRDLSVSQICASSEAKSVPTLPLPEVTISADLRTRVHYAGKAHSAMYCDSCELHLEPPAPASSSHLPSPGSDID